ncbi:MAG: hypothetical protein H8E57_04640, partial [Candidatus Cloacimonetes bacterium]|nr:hypothetical protein [Candidatus Cloacimonadota bacterium]
LTFLYPSEDGNSPITEIQRSDGSSYAVKAQHANETGYYVIGDAACDFNFDGNYFHVNGDFFAIKGSMLSYDSNDDVVISSIILNSGDHIECSDHTDSKSLVYYQSEEVYEELLASYTDKGELYITIKKTTNTQPRYKIFHQNISPENIFCKTVYDAKDKQLIEIEDNNISHLAYDDEYFYVNYSPEELANVNSVGELVMNRGYDRLTVETLKETTKSGFWKILDFIFCK